jgi:hypothetical protein
MTVVEAGEEYDYFSNSEFDFHVNYFLKRVADINADQSKDVRDVSITRMAIVGGYFWDIVTGEEVTGADVIRNVLTSSFETVTTSLANGRRASLYSDMNYSSASLDINISDNIFLDLNGKTLTLDYINLRTVGANATITIKNGTISVANDLTLSAPNGNVVIDNVVAYVNGSKVNLQAAQNSLHLANAVKFFGGAINDETPVPATVYVEEGTHVVLEAQAEVVIEKIVVTENNFAQEASVDSFITLDNKTETVVEV